MAATPMTFKTKTVQSICQLHFKDEKTKVNADALALLAELLRVFTSEAAERSAVQAERDGSNMVTVEHMEKILPQLTLLSILTIGDEDAKICWTFNHMRKLVEIFLVMRKFGSTSALAGNDELYK